MPQVDWKFASIWNDSLVSYAERPIKPRDYIYASELGFPFIDRYLKMLGTKPTNPPNNRSLRKFQAGSIWEAIVGFVLVRAGIMKKRQVTANVQIADYLPVHGRLDYIAGGKVDWEKAEREIHLIEPLLDMFPEFLRYACTEIMERLRVQYTNEFLEKILEFKSCSSFVFERNRRSNTANAHHVLQNFHYLIGEEFDFGAVTYISRDDCRLLEFPVYSTMIEVRQKYEADIKAMTDFYVHKELPPKEPEIIFDDGACKFNKNWKVEYSYYLTKIYKYKTPADYRMKYEGLCRSFNYTMKRCVDGVKLTEKNKEAVRVAKKIFPRWDDYVILARERGVLELVEEED